MHGADANIIVQFLAGDSCIRRIRLALSSASNRSSCREPCCWRWDEGSCGDVGWIVDLAGDPRGVRVGLEWMGAGPDRDAWLA